MGTHRLKFRTHPLAPPKTRLVRGRNPPRQNFRGFELTIGLDAPTLIECWLPQTLRAL